MSVYIALSHKGHNNDTPGTGIKIKIPPPNKGNVRPITGLGQKKVQRKIENLALPENKHLRKEQ